MEEKTILVGVRICDGETGEFLEYETYDVSVRADYDIRKDGLDEVFKSLFKSYPDDFPEEEPGVNATITEITDGDDRMDF